MQFREKDKNEDESPKGDNKFFDDEFGELEDSHSRGYGRGGYRRGRGRGSRYRGGYQGDYNRRGSNRKEPQGKFERNPNYHLQEKFKDDFF
jgi:hypothetical protein